MTGSKVLIVKLPELRADVKQLEAFRAYVCDALGAGALVLPLGTTYAVEDFPALGAVEVESEAPVPVVLGGPEPTPAGGGGGLVVDWRHARPFPISRGAEKPKPPLSDIPAAEGVSRPEPKPVEPPERPPEEKPDVPKPQPDAPAKPAPILRSPPLRSAAPRSHAMPMSESEIVASYRQAAKPAAQITVLADLNACSKERIEGILREAGEPLPKKRGRQKRTEE